MKSVLLCATALAVTAPGVARAQLPADFEAQARDLIEQSYDETGPGAVVIVVDDGKIVLEEGRGFADVEAGTPITPDTVFRYASITKQFTAATILQLIAEGKVSLDAPLKEYLPDYPGEGGEATVRQLLNHTSGIMSYTAIPGFMVAKTDRPLTTAEMIDVIKAEPMPAKNGERFEYNNSGYVLLGAVIEAVTGDSWDEAVRERIARPLGLETLDSGLYEARFPTMARGYTKIGEDIVPAKTINMSVPHAAGALVGTVGDLAKWALALHSGKIVNDALYSEMIAPTTLPDGRTDPYGFGLSNGEVRGKPTIGHSGGIFGFSTNSLYMPDEDLFVAVLANSDSPKTNTGVVMRRLAALAIGKPYPDYEVTSLDPDLLDGRIGRYQWDGGTRDLILEDGKLYTQREGSPRLEVFHAGDGLYFYGSDSMSFFTLAKAEDGTPVMVFHPEGADEGETSRRTGDVPSGPAEIALSAPQRDALVGTYALPIGPFTIGERDGKMTGRLGPQEPEFLKSYAPDRLGAPEFGAEFVFAIEDGRAVSMTLRQGGREIAGERSGD
ncbi:serine hydrolase domain-containing protein [Sphingomicrobium nitratireducens]|uniref:serine hydrolase domain-containing protein n=1 Tax=Sphingomicrobium nitratireducens TaxID=2964666 RepID=UPI00223FEC86|nr:serine hydrolase domain-containing protein [Sphingomicrobium nitratireducens]